MKLVKGLFFASFVSVALVMLFSFLPTVGVKDFGEIEKGVHVVQRKEETGIDKPRREKPVFQVTKPIILEKADIVSFLKEIPLEYSYKKVRLERQDIFIDIQVQGRNYSRKKIYQDAYQIVKAVFMHTSNIKQLYLRFILIGEEHDSLLISVNCERSVSLMDGIKLVSKGYVAPTFFEDYTEVIYGTGWSNN